MDSLIVQIGVGGAFAVTILGMVFAFLIKFRVSDKQLVVQLAAGQKVMLDKECSERLLKTMQNTEYLLRQHSDMKAVLQDLRSERAANSQLNDAVLEGLQENTRTLHALGLQIAAF